MDALETLVRETLVERAADAPSDDRLLAAVTQAPRRRPWLAGGLAAALVLGIAAGALVLRNPRHHAEPAAPSVPAGYRNVSYHGIALNVPARLGPIAARPCGFVHEAVIDETRGVNDCPGIILSHPPPPLGTVVLLGDSGNRDPVVPTAPTTVGGMAAQRGYGMAEVIDDRRVPAGIVVLSTRDIVVEVTAPTRKQIDAVLNSIRPEPPNPLGCAERVAPMDDSSAPHVPANPVSAIVCGYRSPGQETTQWLIGSARATGHQATLLIGAARDWVMQTGPQFPNQPRYRITLAYKDGATRTFVTPAPEVGRIVGIS